MESSVVMSALDRLQRVSRNAEKTLALECKKLQSKFESLPADREDRVRALRSIADHIDEMNEKLAECGQSRDKLLSVCKQRLRYFHEGCRDDAERLLDWLLCDYLSRRGFLQSAKMLASCSRLTELIDIAIFEQHRHILHALRSHSTTPALHWCQTNKSRLPLTGSHLEVHLRLREFVDLVKNRAYIAAIQYVKEHMVSAFEGHTTLLKRHLGLLALFDQTVSGDLGLYSDLLDDSCWNMVQAMFSQTFFQMHKLSPDPQLDLFLKTGLSALKSQSCGTPNKSMSNCPVCSQDVVELAARLKPAPKTMSCLVCRLTGDVMDESNPPMVVPNGQVYSKAGLHSLALVNGGHIRCPETGAVYSVSDCKNVFVL